MPLDRNDVYARICALIAEQLNISTESMTPESQLEKLGADSLDRVEIVMKLEEEFGVEINDEEAERITTIGQAVDYINTLIEKA